MGIEISLLQGFCRPPPSIFCKPISNWIHDLLLKRLSTTEPHRAQSFIHGK
jgi:hypothetical protein